MQLRRWRTRCSLHREGLSVLLSHTWSETSSWFHSGSWRPWNVQSPRRERTDHIQSQSDHEVYAAYSQSKTHKYSFLDRHAVHNSTGTLQDLAAYSAFLAAARLQTPSWTSVGSRYYWSICRSNFVSNIFSCEEDDFALNKNWTSEILIHMHLNFRPRLQSRVLTAIS